LDNHRRYDDEYPHYSGYNYETYVPIVADYFDKNLHYDATHYLYEPEDMKELLMEPKVDATDFETIQDMI